MKRFALLSLLFFCSLSLAYADNDLVAVAWNLSGPMATLISIFKVVLWVAGAALLLGTLIQYKAHRSNPSQVRLTKPVMFFVMGTLLILLPFLLQAAFNQSMMT